MKMNGSLSTGRAPSCLSGLFDDVHQRLSRSSCHRGDRTTTGTEWARKFHAIKQCGVKKRNTYTRTCARVHTGTQSACHRGGVQSRWLDSPVSVSWLIWTPLVLNITVGGTWVGVSVLFLM